MADTWKAIFSSDWHFSNALPHAKPGFDGGLTDRLGDELRVLDQMFETAEREKADAVFLLGDLFDKPRPDPIALREVVKRLVRSRFDLFVLDGNHDAQTLHGGVFVTEVFGALGHAHITHLSISSPITPRPWLTLQPLPYSNHELARARLADLASEPKPEGSTRVALIHQAIIGAKHQGWTCDDGLDGEEVARGFDYVFAGHFHTHQEFSGGRGMYLGAPMHHHFGDVGDELRGWWVVTFGPNGEVERRHVPSKAPRFHVFAAAPGKLWDRAWLDQTAEGDYVRIDVECTGAEWASLAGEVAETEKALSEAKRFPRVHHKPVYHHVRRMALRDGMEAGAMMREALSAWLDGPAVVGETMDRDQLRAVGLELFEDAARAG